MNYLPPDWPNWWLKYPEVCHLFLTVLSVGFGAGLLWAIWRELQRPASS